MADIKLKRPPVDPARMKRKWALTIACFGIGLFLMILSVFLCQDIRARKMRAVTLDAVVTNVERVHRGEDVEYDVYVTYRYEGIDYSACYKSSTDEEWFDRIGVKVSVVIDSEEPDVLIEDLLDGAFFAFFFGLPIFAAGFYFVGLPVRKSYTEFYGSSSEAIMADWVSEERRKLLWLSLFVYSVGEIVWGVYMGDIGGAFSANVLLGFMVAPFWIVLLVRYIIKVVKTKDCAQNYVKSS